MNTGEPHAQLGHRHTKDGPSLALASIPAHADLQKW